VDWNKQNNADEKRTAVMSQIYVVSGFEIGDVSPDRLSHSAPCSNGKTASKKYVLTKKKYTPTLIKNLQRYEMINK